MYLRLSDEYSIKKYVKRYFLCYWGSAWRMEVAEEEMDILKLCDGVTDISDEFFEQNRDIFEKFMEDGETVLRIDAPKPLLPSRAYREFDHRRRYTAIWTITTHCNIDCIHCLYGLLHHLPDATLEDAQKIIDHLAEYGIERIGIFGGEPFVHPHFWEILDMIQASGMQIGEIDTNGMFLNEENLKRLLTYNTSRQLAVSFDGLGTHDWMRNFDGCEKITLDGIDLACKMGFDVLASINVNKKTAPRMDETIDKMVELGCKRIRFLATSKTPKWMETTAAEPEDPTMSMDEYGEFVVHTTEQHIDQIRSGIPFSIYTQLMIRPKETGATLLRKINQKPEKTTAWCTIGCDGVFVSSQGGVLLCKGMEFISHFNGLDAREYNIVDHSLEEVFDTDLFKELRFYSKKDILACSPQCQSCDKWDMCMGGTCRGCAIGMQGFEFSKENVCSSDMVTCAMYKGGYMERIAKILDEHPVTA